MSNTTAPSQPLPDLDPKIGLISVAADSLIPLFKKGATSEALARQMAISAIEAYNPETRADAVNIARTIAFSTAALALLGSAGAEDVPLAQKLRAYSRAIALNRSADQSERTMMQRRRYQQAHPFEDQEEPPAEPASLPTEADMQAVEAEIRAVLDEALKQENPTSQPALQAPQSPPRAAAPASAIHQSVPKTNPGHPPTASFKSGLLHQSALHSVISATASTAANLIAPPSVLPPVPAGQSNKSSIYSGA